MAGEKTEKATPKRKQDERKKGNIFLSREVVTVASLIASFFFLKFMFPFIFNTLKEALIEYTAMGATLIEVTPKDIRKIFFDGALLFVKTAFPLLMVTTLVAILATIAQTKMLFSAQAFNFKGERINPLKGLKKIFSMRSAVELLKSILKISILMYILYSILLKEVHNLPKFMYMQPIEAMTYTGEIIMKVVMQAVIIFVFLTIGDYFYQWWEYEKNLRMSKQEIKDEYKQMEGDPQVKGQIRNLQQQRARQRMIQNVPEADVVIRNPTHYAIAIKYDQSKMRAPVVVAKGADAVALRIIKVAEESGVYITENRPLARALFEAVDLDMEVPGEFYEAIAEVLAFVYRLKKKGLN